MIRKSKPHYGPNDHVLYVDIVADKTPLQYIRLAMRYDHIILAYGAAVHLVNIGVERHNTAGMLSFLAACQAKWELSAKVADMFTSPNAGIILPGAGLIK